MRRFLLLLPIGCGSILISQYFQSIGKAPVALFIAMTRQLVFQIPLILLLPLVWGYDGVLFSGPLGDAIAFILAFFIMRREIIKIKARERIEDTTAQAAA